MNAFNLRTPEQNFGLGIKQLANAWELRKKELEYEKNAKLSSLTQELNELKSLLDGSKSQILMLEDRKLQLQHKIEELNAKNVKLEDFKRKMIESLETEETPYQSEYITSPILLEEEFYRQNMKSPTENIKSSKIIKSPNRISPRQDDQEIYNETPKKIENKGRLFFIQAKARLSFEKFTDFSSYVKQLNEETITKHSALLEIKEIFGSENSDLFESFANLLSKT